ncbi:MAG: pyridoxamine 5'-phosphate oxidase family protein [Candidatus Omnitrophica bacterium]|nr:pyridoxamine 5'-phosphate oxidase family protein [Candidatus Omnitrophota bacterium]
MKELSNDIINFFNKQGFVIVSTIDSQGFIHCSAKGIAGIEKEGKIYVIDLYRGGTFNNLKNNPVVSITAVDEKHFTGYTLKGRARIVEKERLGQDIIREWEERVVKRISQRLIKNIQEEKKNSHHPEAELPPVQYLIEIEVENIVDLTPAHIKRR